MANTVKFAVSAVGTVITYLTGGWSVSVVTLVVFLIGDYITGVARAFIEKKLSSQVGFKGLAKKCMIMLILIVAVMLDRLMGNDMWLFRSAVCYFYIANEGISMLENVAGMGVPIPEKLLSVLDNLSERSQEDIDVNALLEEDKTEQRIDNE